MLLSNCCGIFLDNEILQSQMILMMKTAHTPFFLLYTEDVN